MIGFALDHRKCSHFTWVWRIADTWSSQSDEGSLSAVNSRLLSQHWCWKSCYYSSPSFQEELQQVSWLTLWNFSIFFPSYSFIFIEIDWRRSYRLFWDAQLSKLLALTFCDLRFEKSHVALLCLICQYSLSTSYWRVFPRIWYVWRLFINFSYLSSPPSEWVSFSYTTDQLTWFYLLRPFLAFERCCIYFSWPSLSLNLWSEATGYREQKCPPQ